MMKHQNLNRLWKLLKVTSKLHVKYMHGIVLKRMFSDQFGNLQEPIDLSQLQKLKFTKHSTKVIWLVKFLQTLLSADASDKIVVVSQFVDVITKVGEMLTNTRIPFQACKFTVQFHVYATYYVY